jgi:hypothetical protein
MRSGGQKLPQGTVTITCLSRPQVLPDFIDHLFEDLPTKRSTTRPVKVRCFDRDCAATAPANVDTVQGENGCCEKGNAGGHANASCDFQSPMVVQTENHHVVTKTRGCRTVQSSLPAEKSFALLTTVVSQMRHCRAPPNFSGLRGARKFK